MDASGATSHHSSRRSSRHSHHEGRSGRKSRRHSDTHSTSSSARSAPRRTSPMTALERAGGRPGSESHGRSATKRPAAALAVGIPSTAATAAAAAAADDQQKMRRIRIALVVLRMLVVGMGAVILFHVVRGLQKLHEWYPNTHLLAISLAKYFILIGAVMISHILLLFLWTVLTVWPDLRSYMCCTLLPLRPYTCEIVGDLIWAGVWIAMLVAVYLQNWGYWVNTLCGVLAITMCVATAALTAWWRLLKDRADELAAGTSPIASITYPRQGAAGAAGRKYLATRGHDLV